MSKTRLLAAFTAVALVAGSPPLLADPGNGKGNPHANQNPQGNSANKGNPGGANASQGQGKHGDSDWSHGPSIDVGGVRVILGDNRQYWGNPQPLPPGIQKNLARGKPLPPALPKSSMDG